MKSLRSLKLTEESPPEQEGESQAFTLSLSEKKGHEYTISVIGLGYVGLPTALTFSRQGFRVRGYDKNAGLVDQLKAGRTDINETGIADLLTDGLQSERFQAHADIQLADAYFICVPTPVCGASHAPDLAAVFSAVENIQRVIKPGDLVVLESTSPVGTTRRIYEQLLAHLQQAYPQEMTAGGRLYAAYCPERILPGRVLEELTTLDRVIGGVDAASSALAKSFFLRLTRGQCHETDAETAEFVKLSENAFRDVNIAFANELKNLCEQHGVAVNDVRNYANMHPRVNILQPGIGVGGHCIPIDPWFLIHASLPGESSVIRASREINDRQPKLIADRITEIAKQNNHKKLAVFGLTYKENVNDFRESPALDILKHLSDTRHFSITAYDPFIQNDTHRERLPDVAARDMTDIAEADVYVFLVAHEECKELYRNLSEQGRSTLNFCNL